MIRLLIAAGVRFYREGLAEILPAAGTITVVATASDWTGAVRAATESCPTAALVDAAMVPAHDRLHELKRVSTHTKVLVIALPSSAEDVVSWVEAGADGYVPRDASLAELRSTIEAAARGEVYCSPEVAAHLFRRISTLSRAHARTAATLFEALTPRERQIANLIADGLSNKGISRQLGIEIATTKNHVHRILAKLSLQRRGQVTAWRYRRDGEGVRA